MAAKHLKTHGGKLKKGAFTIDFTCEDVGSPGEAAHCQIWTPQQDAPVAVSLLNAPSGSGKSSFLHCLHAMIDGTPSPIDFEFTPKLNADEGVAVSIVPQNPPMVRHWIVRSLVPESAAGTGSFLAGLFDENDSTQRLRKRLGEHSGGQQKKIYTASALENLKNSDATAAFLLLDETFDGLGATEACRSLNSILSRWTNLTEKSLHILMVTHLNDEDVAKIHLQLNSTAGSTTEVRCLRLTLAILSEHEKVQTVRVRRRHA